MDYDLQELLVHLTDRSQFAKSHPNYQSHIPDISQIDMAHAAGIVSSRLPDAMLYLIVKYCFSHKIKDNNIQGLYGVLCKKLELAMWLETARRIDGTWKGGGKGLIRRMAQAALAESIDPNKCRSCGGTEIAIKDNLLITCPICEGSGNRFITDKDREETAEIKDFKKYSKRYSYLQLIPAEWERSGLEELRKVLNLWPYRA